MGGERRINEGKRKLSEGKSAGWEMELSQMNDGR